MAFDFVLVSLHFVQLSLFVFLFVARDCVPGVPNQLSPFINAERCSRSIHTALDIQSSILRIGQCPQSESGSSLPTKANFKRFFLR